MIRSFSICLVFMLNCISSPVVSADQSMIKENTMQAPSTSVIETGFLEARPGYTGNVLGAEVEKVTIDEAQQSQIIEINLPIDPDEVDRVQVISVSGKPIPQDKTAQIIRDYENDNVGIKLYLPKKKDWVFKLKLVDEPGIGSD